MILVPVKNLASAKQRLAGVLDQASRTELAQTMLMDVLQAIAACGRDKASLVTSDAFAIEHAADFGFEIIPDDSNHSETDAIETATRVCVSRAVQNTLVIPGDIPLIEPDDIAAIYEHAPGVGSVLVPSADRRGTNAALRAPAALFPLRFGNDSFWPHLSAAIATDLPCVALPMARIELDVDTPEDLLNLASVPGEKPSQQLARKLLARIKNTRANAERSHESTAAEP
jgi:2-phospho-L-lactate guanylyltransferase